MATFVRRTHFRRQRRFIYSTSNRVVILEPVTIPMSAVTPALAIVSAAQAAVTTPIVTAAATPKPSQAPSPLTIPIVRVAVALLTINQKPGAQTTPIVTAAPTPKVTLSAGVVTVPIVVAAATASVIEYIQGAITAAYVLFTEREVRVPTLRDAAVLFTKRTSRVLFTARNSLIQFVERRTRKSR